MREIDFTLAPSAEEVVTVTSMATIQMFDLVDVAIKAAKAKGGTTTKTCGDFKWIAGYVLMAGYVLGVRNERNRKAGRARCDHG